MPPLVGRSTEPGHIETKAGARDDLVFPMHGQYLLDPNEINTWGLVGPYDRLNTQDAGNVGAASFSWAAGGLMFPFPVRVAKMRLAWRKNNVAAHAFGFVLASFTPTASSASTTVDYILDEVGDNGGVGPREPTSTTRQLSEWTFDHVVPADDVITFGVAAPTAAETNYYMQISAGYLLLERV